MLQPLAVGSYLAHGVLLLTTAVAYLVARVRNRSQRLTTLYLDSQLICSHIKELNKIKFTEAIYFSLSLLMDK